MEGLPELTQAPQLILFHFMFWMHFQTTVSFFQFMCILRNIACKGPCLRAYLHDSDGLNSTALLWAFYIVSSALIAFALF